MKKNTVHGFLNNCYAILFAFTLFFIGCKPDPSPPLSPEEAINSFVLAEDDLQIQLVASEPLVQDPVAMAFDGNGRLWVVEMLGFMADIDGRGEKDKVGRISVLFDDDGDGQMDRSHVFMDSLVLPRAMALVDGGVLISENIPLWFAQDIDGDFKVDSKILIDSSYGGQGMPEHSANGLWRGMDNWIYSAKSKFRYKKIDGGWIKEETEFRGQWGICHDNSGRLFYNYNWSQLHADLVPPNVLQSNENHTPSSGIDHGLTLDRKIYPVRSNTAINRGYVPGTLDEEGRLLEFASACGPLVYRGDALPAEFFGDAFVCEPTANLIKRNKIIEEGFMLSAKEAYKNREFLASTDERFRPVSLSSGPDGALYIVDMYKGIIQHGPYMTPYLRKVTLERKLDKPIHMGRIWRITSKKEGKKAIPNMETADSATLVGLLDSPNGWTRDRAQQLLVDQKDFSVVPNLKHLIATGSPLGRLHALWTLEGLNYDEPDIYLDALKMEDSKVAQAALRIVSDLSSEQPEKIEEFISDNYDTADPMLQMQMVLSAHAIDPKIAFGVSKKFLSDYGRLPVARDVAMSSLGGQETNLLKELLSQDHWKNYDQNNEIFLEMLATAISNKGIKKEIEYLLDIIGQKNEQIVGIRSALANGILNSRGSNDDGEIVLGAIPTLLAENDTAENDYKYLLKRLDKKLTWPGKPKEAKATNDPSPIVDSKVFAMGRQKFLNLCASCHGTQGEGMAHFAPPLKNSEWVTGEDYKLAMILLHGMEGPVDVDGKKYDIPDILPEMPSFSTLQNQDIGAIATYIRNSWGHSQSPVSGGTIGRVRYRTQGKITPWKASELDTLVFDANL